MVRKILMRLIEAARLGVWEMAEIPRLPLSDEGMLHRSRYIALMMERGLEDQGAIIGYHGTNLFSIEEALRTGLLPTSRWKGGETHEGLFFLPVPRIELQNLGVVFSSHKEAIHEASIFARMSAREFAFYHSLGLDSCSPKVASGLNEFLVSDHRIDLLFEALGKKVPRIKLYEKREEALALQEVHDSQGIVVGISERILGKMRITEGGDSVSRDSPLKEDCRIHCPDGLPIEFLGGIEPMGQWECRYFESLQDFIG